MEKTVKQKFDQKGVLKILRIKEIERMCQDVVARMKLLFGLMENVSENVLEIRCCLQTVKDVFVLRG